MYPQVRELSNNTRELLRCVNYDKFIEIDAQKLFIRGFLPIISLFSRHCIYKFYEDFYTKFFPHEVFCALKTRSLQSTSLTSDQRNHECLRISQIRSRYRSGRLQFDHAQVKNLEIRQTK